MMIRYFFFCISTLQVHAQIELLLLADSLALYGKPEDALALYDSVLRQDHLSAEVRLRAYAGSLRPLTGLRRFSEVYLRADSTELLALRLKDTLQYAAALSVRGEALTRHSRYTEADTILQKALDILQMRYMETAVYAAVLHRMGLLKHFQGDYVEAERQYRLALALRSRLIGIKHPDYAWTANNLANVYAEQGRHTEAEKLLLEVKKIRARVLGAQHPDYTITLNSLALVYQAQGRYAEAEKLLLEVKASRAQVLGTQHPSYATALNSLALVYQAQGRYTEAEKLLLEVKAIRSQSKSKEDPAFASALNNLANVYVYMGKYAEAETLFLEARAIRARLQGIEHPDYATALGNLALVCRFLGKYEEAERIYLEAKDIWARTLGPEHPRYAGTLNNLALVYQDQGKYVEAEKLLSEARAIQSRVLGTNHPDYYFYSGYNLASLYVRQARYTEADPLWDEMIEKVFTRIRRDFLAMPTVHRQQLIENLLASRLQAYQQYVAMRGDRRLAEQGYRVARSVKGLLLSSTEAMKWLLEDRKSDTTLQSLYADWRRLSEQYVAFALREDYTTADSLWQQAALVEKVLVQRLPELAAFFPDLDKEPLLPPLKKGEIAVEVIRIPAEEVDSVLYLFYVIESGKKTVRLYVHRVNRAWEQQTMAAYEILRSPGATITAAAYHLLWGFIDSLLPKGARAIYFSPDGIYYRVNIASLYDGQRFVIDKYDVRYIATTRRLIVRRPKLPMTKPVVIGNPYFGGQADSLSEVRQREYRIFSGGIPPLPGAEEEARRIAQLVGVEAMIGASATENFVKGLSSPQVLHIATHGYFMGTGKVPMLEGGILLAQAALWDSLYPPLGTEDGRLTAQEASTLNLLGTDLVVLSACETGLGEVTGEGVYGLQRAFLEAGAKRTITALWQIDDEATRELMESFYRRWWWETSARTQGKRENVGLRIDTVFMETLREFRRKYPAPYYWGAFVLMR